MKKSLTKNGEKTSETSARAFGSVGRSSPEVDAETQEWGDPGKESL